MTKLERAEELAAAVQRAEEAAANFRWSLANEIRTGECSPDGLRAYAILTRVLLGSKDGSSVA